MNLPAEAWSKTDYTRRDINAPVRNRFLACFLLRNNSRMEKIPLLEHWNYAVPASQPVEKWLNEKAACNWMLFLCVNFGLLWWLLSEINKKRVWTYDPAIGKLSYKKEDFLKIWSGYLVLVSPTPDFIVQKGGYSLLKFVPYIYCGFWT